jgi:hypothetical protein
MYRLTRNHIGEVCHEVVAAVRQPQTRTARTRGQQSGACQHPKLSDVELTLRKATCRTSDSRHSGLIQGVREDASNSTEAASRRSEEQLRTSRMHIRRESECRRREV